MNIGVTQNMELRKSRNETIELLDIRVIDFLSKLNFSPIILSSVTKNINEYLRKESIKGIILTGGCDVGKFILRDNFERKLITYCKKNNIPILGICRGMQFINNYFGGKSKKIFGHVRTKHKISGKKYYYNQKVNSYHKLGIFPDNLSPDLDILAQAEDTSVEALKHKKFKIHGIMWHPERELIFKNKDKTLIKNIFKK